MQYIIPCMLCKRANTDSLEIVSERKVYVSVKTASRNEFYQANAAGHTIEKVVVLRKMEYNNEELLKLNNDIYTILRVYDKGNGTLELSLEKETRIYDQAATLIWYTYEDESVKHELNVLVRDDSLSGNEFSASYQTGINIMYVFKMKASDYELSKTLDKETNKPLYATSIQFGGASYDIVKLIKKKSIDEIELICQ